MVASISCGWMPNPTDSAPCGSKSTRSTRRPCSARAAPRLIVVVVLPTPPFWLQTATVRAGPCSSSASGSGKGEYGLPVGPSSPAWGSVIRDAATSTNLLGYGRDGAHGSWVWTLGPGPGPGKQARRLHPISTCRKASWAPRFRHREAQLSRFAPAASRTLARYRASGRGHAGCWSAAIVGRPVGLPASGQGVGEHLVLLPHAGVAEVRCGTAVRGPCRGAELVQAVVARGVHHLGVAAGLAGDHARAERSARRAAGVRRGARDGLRHRSGGHRASRGRRRLSDRSRRSRRWHRRRRR